MRQIKLFLLFLLLLIPSVSAYQNIPVIGNYYEYAMEVNLHLGDNTDNDLTPPAPTGLSYTNTFSFYGSRKDMKLDFSLQPSMSSRPLQKMNANIMTLFT